PTRRSSALHDVRVIVAAAHAYHPFHSLRPLSYPTTRDPSGGSARAKAPDLPPRIGPRCLGYPVIAAGETTTGPGEAATFRHFYATRMCANYRCGHPVGQQ